VGYLTRNFQALLLSCEGEFTKPSFVLFCALMTGWVLSIRHRYVTELIYASNNIDNGHWSRFHRFFSHNAWSLDTLSMTIASLLVDAFVPEGVIVLALDDTLCRKRGLKLFGAGMHHDPLLSSKKMKLVSWGHVWVVVSLVVCLPAWAPSKIFSLPIGFRLYRNRQGNNKGKKKEQDNRSRCPRQRKKHPKKTTQHHKTSAASTPVPNHRTRPELGLELLCVIARTFPNRVFVVCVDSLYGGKSILSKLPVNVHCISRVHAKGVLYAPAPAPTGKRGPRRKKGERLSSMQEWANDDTPWTDRTFDRYGLHAELSVKTRQGLYYTAGKDRLLTFVLVRDNAGKRPLCIFYCTLLDWTAEQILSTYASRWSIEVAFENGKQMLGFEDPANRLPAAVERTAPMAMLLVSLVTLWFHKTGHRHVKFPRRPWYTRKKEPSFGDMLSTLRRLSWTESWQRAAGDQCQTKKILAQMTEFLSRPG
jgi:DDE superfamily endonuclease